MAEYITPGRSKVYWVTTLTSTTSPSAAEIVAGVNLTPVLRGIPDLPRSANTADASDLSSTFEKRARGTVGGDSGTFQLKRLTGTETAYAALDEGDEGFLVVFRKGTAGASPAASDVADVYPAQVNTIADDTPGRNDIDSVTVTIVLTDNPSRDATVAA